MVMLSTGRRIELLVQLGGYMMSGNEEWQDVQARALSANAWFTQPHITMAVSSITNYFLQAGALQDWVSKYDLPVSSPKKLGIVMAGNIPLVGFHDFLSGFMSGHIVMMKLSSKDSVLLTHLVKKLTEWEPSVANHVVISEMLKDCDAYIATGSNNTARYFEQYFGKFPNIIRRNRTSVAVLDGTETAEELDALADDIFSYFGLGCRNVTQLCLPEGYDITKLFPVFEKYKDVINHNKYKNNYDYYLAIYMLNRVPFHTDDTLLMVENPVPFSAVSVLHYRFYTDKASILEELSISNDIQCVVGHAATQFGQTQQPTLTDYPDGVDTMQFMTDL